MKKTLIALGVVIVLGGFLAPIHEAHAYTATATELAADKAMAAQCKQKLNADKLSCDTTDPATGATYHGQYWTTDINSGGWSFDKTAKNGTETSFSESQLVTAAGSTNVSTDANGAKTVTTKGLSGQDCSGVTGFFSCLIDAPSHLIALILQGLVDLLYWMLFGLVWLSASMLDFTTSLLVINMGKFINSSSAAGIQAAWQVVRDIANIGIIGGLIATAISTILQISNYGAQKFLAKLIIAAVLVNFSYFFAGTIIDSSNFLATAVYTDMVTTKDGCTPQTCTITWRFMKTTNFQNLHDNLPDVGSTQGFKDAQSAQGTGELGPWMTLLVDILSVVFELITIFVFLSALALIVGRFVALVFILITSPVGIAGSAIPGLGKYARQWWNILFAQAFFAPVYFLLLDFSFRVLEGAKSGILAGASQAAGTQALGIILTFLITATFMLLSLKTAKKMSESGKEYFEPIYKGAEMLMGGSAKLYQYGLRAVGTETIGRAGLAAGEYYRDTLAPRLRLDNVPILSTIDRRLQAGLDSIGKATFGGKTGSYADTKEARRQRTIGLTKQEEVLRQEEERKAAAAEEAARKKDVDAIGKETERGEDEDAPSDNRPIGDAAPIASSGGGSGSSRTEGGNNPGGGSGGAGGGPGGTGGGSGGAGGGPSGTGGGSGGTTSGTGGVSSGTTGEHQRPAATRPQEAKKVESGPREVGRVEAKDVGNPAEAGAGTIKESEARAELDRHRIYFKDDDGKEVPETDSEMMARMGITSVDQLFTDGKDGPRRPKNENQLRREFGRQFNVPLNDPKTGEIRYETPEEFNGRYSGVRRVVPITWRGKIHQVTNGQPLT